MKQKLLFNTLILVVFLLIFSGCFVQSKADIILQGDVYGAADSNGVPYLTLTAFNAGAATANDVKAIVTVTDGDNSSLELATYTTHLGSIRAGESRTFEVKLEGFSWGDNIGTSTVFQWK